MSIRRMIADKAVEASAPCRIDMGGTLDLSTFYLPLRHLKPCTFNIALDMRTTVRISGYETGKIKISSRGFDSLVVDAASAPYDHPLGLMLAVSGYFGADGVHIDIHSASPPRSALGGSSVAAVALIWAFSKALQRDGNAMPERSHVALLAHAIEQSVAGVPCGLQDMLAAVYGGVNVWQWNAVQGRPPFTRQPVVSDGRAMALDPNLLVAYCGNPHVSKDVNGTWVRQFVAGNSRPQWNEIVECSRSFASAMLSGELRRAMDAMNRETDIRRGLTPEVLDEMGSELVRAARDHGCGARFTGAGGGGCIWALGEPGDVADLRSDWEVLLGRLKGATVLETAIDTVGLL